MFRVAPFQVIAHPPSKHPQNPRCKCNPRECAVFDLSRHRSACCNSASSRGTSTTLRRLRRQNNEDHDPERESSPTTTSVKNSLIHLRRSSCWVQDVWTLAGRITVPIDSHLSSLKATFHLGQKPFDDLADEPLPIAGLEKNAAGHKQESTLNLNTNLNDLQGVARNTDIILEVHVKRLCNCEMFMDLVNLGWYEKK